MNKLKATLECMFIDGLCKQDVINLEKTYGYFITIDGVHINMFTKTISKVGFDIVKKAIECKLIELQKEENSVSILTLSDSVKNLGDYIFELKELLLNNPIDNVKLDILVNGNGMMFYNEEKELISLLDVCVVDVVTTYSSTLLEINPDVSYVIRRYSEVVDASIGSYETLRDVFNTLSNVDKYCKELDVRYDKMKNTLHDSLTSNNDELKGMLENCKKTHKRDLLLIELCLVLVRN